MEQRLLVSIFTFTWLFSKYSKGRWVLIHIIFIQSKFTFYPVGAVQFRSKSHLLNKEIYTSSHAFKKINEPITPFTICKVRINYLIIVCLFHSCVLFKSNEHKDAGKKSLCLLKWKWLFFWTGIKIRGSSLSVCIMTFLSRQNDKW